MKEKIIVLLTEINPYEELDETMNLIDTHFLDSMGILILIDKIEEAFDVEIDIEKLNKNDFEYIDNICSLIKKLKI